MTLKPNRPFSQACENNREPILAVLRKEFAEARCVLELGSGTGQHASYFVPRLPQLKWQPTDVAENLAGIEAWCEGVDARLLAPQQLDIRADAFPVGNFDALFSANTLHIMDWPLVQLLFQRLAPLPLKIMCFYGPFNYGGMFTSDSNARFNEWLLSRGVGSAIRDCEAVCELASEAGFRLRNDHAMPANNRLLCFERV